MVITMVSMGRMKASFYNIIYMVAMRNGFMTASWSINMSSFMSLALGIGGADIWVDIRHFNHMFLHLIFSAWMMKVTIVKVINVAVVLDSRVSTIFNMFVCGFHV